MPMMEPLYVPPRFIGSLRALAGLSDDDFAKLLDFLNNQEQLLPPQRLGREIAGQLSGLADYAEGILGAAVSLISRAPHDPDAANESAERVSLSPELGLKDEQRAAFVDRLANILCSPSIRLASKASDLAADYDRVYYGARILTDIRPVFSDSENEMDPVAAVVMANLKIEHYGPEGDLISFHVALNHGDLLELSEVVKRGLEKAEASKGFLQKKSMSYLRDTESNGSD